MAASYDTPDLDFACALLALGFIPLIEQNGDDHRHIYKFPLSKCKESDLREVERQFYSGDLQVRAQPYSKARQRILFAQRAGRQL